MKKLAVLTATRAEYGLLKNFILKLQQCTEFVTEVVVTGAHLSDSCGMTYKEIEKDGIKIAYKVDMKVDSSSPSGISKSMGRAMMGVADYFEVSKPDAILVLGDRYETLAVCCSAMNAQVPIFHLYGGETTEGAIDEAVRHSITKMSYLHFTSTEEYRHRVIQLGENPDRVFCVGAVGIENALNEPKISKKELEVFTGLDLSKPYAVMTFHPVTLESDVLAQCREVLAAIECFPEIQFIITGANADCGGNDVNNMLMKFAENHNNVFFTLSLGLTRYLSALNYASFVVGNSSSGLVEAPSFGIPTVNIGNRQKGRLRSESVIDCETKTNEIVNAINKALSNEFKAVAKKAQNPYGDGNTVNKVVEIIKEYFYKKEINLQKKFYDVNFEVN